MAGEVMKRKELTRTCQQCDEYCHGCPYVNNHGGCTVGQPWKRKFTVVEGGEIK